ncbi:unnamed protein product [Symbiodinium sp. CCMP2592]|nr:unnamed protein product [Symbiodinium sp. CCMP2592]
MLRQQKSLGVSWPWLQGGDRRAHASLTWVRSHVTAEEFSAEFGEASLWRQQINDAADQLCRKAAARATAQVGPWCPDEIDDLVGDGLLAAQGFRAAGLQ